MRNIVLSCINKKYSSKKVFVFSFCLFSTIILFAQQNFTVSVVPSALTSVPAIHSFSFAQQGSKWLFIGGRTNGLHGFLPPFAFPSSGINDSVFVVDAGTNQRWAASINVLNDSIREQLSSSNAEYFQDDTMLYIVGGYGWKNSASMFVTFPSMIAINVPSLMNAVIYNTNIIPHFRQLQDSVLAVTGGNLIKLDTMYHLVFGHRFDGTYDTSDSVVFFLQRYTNEVRKFKIADDGNALALLNYSAKKDTVNFHRRDFNLVPQIFPDGNFGATAFSGVFRYHINLPFLSSVDIKSDTNVVNSTFNQLLSNYECASMPVFDSANNFMHTVFFGGMGLYFVDSMQNTIMDSLIPFVNTISRVSRSPSGYHTEFRMQEKMPGLLGTNAKFIADTAVTRLHKKIIHLNMLDSISRVGFIVGGISSPQPNISATDASVSSANNIVYDVIVDKRVPPNYVQPVQIKNDVYDFLVYPNPAAELVYVEFKLKKEATVTIELFDSKGKKVQTITTGKFNSDETNKLEFSAKKLSIGNYFLRITDGSSSLVQKLIIRGK